jgi:hypothetical protein
MKRQNILINSISKLASKFLKLAKAPSGIVTYHGTNARFLNNMLQEGILSKVPPGSYHKDKAVYLTNDISQAARYTLKEDLPMILELYLSTPKRLKKIKHDLLDRYDWGDFESEWQEELIYLSKDLSEVLGGWEREIEQALVTDNEIHEIIGMNVYKLILSIARENNLNIQDVKNKLKKLPKSDPNNFFFYISHDGTLQPTKYYYDWMHQMKYPTTLPPSVIKYVWLPERNLKNEHKNNALNANQIYSNYLPGDLDHIRSSIENAFKGIYGTETSEEDKERLLVDLKDINDDFKDSTKELLEEVKGTAPEELSDIDYYEFIPQEGEQALSDNYLRFDIDYVKKKGISSMLKS